VAARARPRGERLEAVDVPPQPLVLVNPGVAVSAGEAYGWWSPGRSSTGATAPWWRGPAIVNDLEAGVAERVPLVGALLERMRLAHDGPVAMSGSGATCFALARDARSASALADRLRSHLPEGTWVATTSLAQRS
jgi:4-diphosphocytidyl-2-C-methyl-D-erythritol kinase